MIKQLANTMNIIILLTTTWSLVSPSPQTNVQSSIKSIPDEDQGGVETFSAVNFGTESREKLSLQVLGQIKDQDQESGPGIAVIPSPPEYYFLQDVAPLPVPLITTQSKGDQKPVNDTVLIDPGASISNPSSAENTQSSAGKESKKKIKCGIRRLVKAPDAKEGDGTTSASTGKIVGGTKSTYIWPWLAAMVKDGMFLGCTASILDEWNIIIASHCITDHETNGPRDVSEVEIRVGNNDWTKAIKIDVERLVKHEQFALPPYYRDVGLIHLKKPLEMDGENIAPLCLPNTPGMEEIILDQQKVTIVGWGTTYEGGFTVQDLREANVTVVPREQCAEMYKKARPDIKRDIPDGVTSDFICAYTPGKDSCQGDSGGPVLFKSKGRFYNMGIVSLGQGCAEKGFPGLYTDVRKFLKWVEDNRKKGS